MIGKSYCIGGDSEKSNLETIHLICDYLDEINTENFPHKNLITFVEDRPGHDKRYAIDSSMLKKELGWEQKYKFEEGIKETLLWYLKNQKWCEAVLNQENYSTERLGIIKK